MIEAAAPSAAGHACANCDRTSGHPPVYVDGRIYCCWPGRGPCLCGRAGYGGPELVAEFASVSGSGAASATLTRPQLLGAVGSVSTIAAALGYFEGNWRLAREARTQAAADEARRARWWEPALLISFFPAIAFSQWVFAYQDVGLGVALALGLVLALYFVVSVVPFTGRYARCADSLALVPLYVLFTSALPWFFLDDQFLLPAVYSIVLVLCLWHIKGGGIDARRLRELGFRKEHLLAWTALGALIAIPTGAVEYWVLRPAAEGPTFEVSRLLRDVVYMWAFVALGEEVLFRALIQRDLAAAFGSKWALTLSSVLFGIMHLTWRSPGEVLFTTAAGFLLGYLYLRTRSLVAPIALHGTNNVMLVSIMPYV